jgi:hypothetical protein
MSEIIVYLRPDGSTSIMVPVISIESSLKDLPQGAIYKVFDRAELPDAPQETWGFDGETINVDWGRIPQPPNWDGLNQAIMANTEFNQAYATVMQTYPLVAAALPAALTQVASGQTSMFETTFLAMCQIAQVTPEQRAIWADIGATYNAPQDFLDIVRGATNGE